MKPVIFSGIQPTAQAPHIGNYLGAFKQWVNMQEDYYPYYCIVDLHALTVPRPAKVLNDAIYASYAMLLAVGIDPKKSTPFVQSHNPYHTELTWLMNCQTSMGELGRMIQFKEKSQKQTEIVSAGLFDYPVLMVADILLYDTAVVPVGEDQTQHVELARDVASRFNKKYGETFRLPKVKLPEVGARIMSLADPTKKMSKSDENPNGCLFLLDSPESTMKKIKSAVTDSERTIIYNPERKGLANLMDLYKALTNLEVAEIEAKYQGKGYKEFKEDLAEIVVNFLKPIQQKYQELISDKGELKVMMKKNAQKATEVSAKKVAEVKQKLGLIL